MPGPGEAICINGTSKRVGTAEENADESLVDLFRKVADDPQLHGRIVLRDPGVRHRANGIRRRPFEAEEWSLGELDDLTEKLALLFVASERFACHKGGCVAIYMGKRKEYASPIHHRYVPAYKVTKVFSYVAALKAGCAYLPLDVSYTRELLCSVLDEVRPSVICTTEEYAQHLPGGTPLFVFDNEGAWYEEVMGDHPRMSNALLPRNITGDDVAYIVYSSGTTGKPKGIACPHRGAVLSYKHRFNTEPYAEDDVAACNVFFVWEFFRPILQAMPMIIIPDEIIYDPAQLCRFLGERRVTTMLFTPSLLETILDTQDEETLRKNFAHFRLIHLCGEVVTTSLVRRFMAVLPHIQYTNLYSISETHDVAVANLNAYHARNEQRQYAPAGRLIECVKVLVLDPELKAVPMGVPGEIYIAGPTLAIGYINRPELNKSRFLEVPLEYQPEVGTRMYKTGDWGYLLPNATLEICGRCDTMVRIRGYSVELRAIESALAKLPYVSSCTVLAIGEEGSDKQLVAYLVLNRHVGRKMIRADLKCHVPHYMVPRFFIFLDKLPVLAASSKLDKRALPSVEPERDTVEAEALPRTPTEIKIAKIWCSLLQQSKIDIHENFFDLGGHSLLAARMLSKFEKEFGVEMTIREFFTHNTVYSMARRLDGFHAGEQRLNLDQEVEENDTPHRIADIHLRAFWRSTEWSTRFSRCNILLTGSTGYVGVHILHQLLLSSQAHVFCLVRQNDHTSRVDERVEKALCERALAIKQMEELKDRITVVSGDTTLINFGLSEEQFHLLSCEIDVVIHAAAQVNLIYPYHALYGANVVGTKNVLSFCLHNKVKVLHYVSTDAVLPAGLTSADEDFPIESFKDELADGYGQSKYVAEKLVERCASRGLPTIVYRLGNQAASSTAGVWNDDDFIYLLLKAVFATGTAPDIEWEVPRTCNNYWTLLVNEASPKSLQVEMSPVDFSAQFIVQLSTGSNFVNSIGKTFHLINTSPPKWGKILDWACEMGFPLRRMPFDDWRRTILASDKPQFKQIQRIMEGMIPTEEFFAEQKTYKRTNTDRLLEGELKGRVACLHVNKALVTKWIRLLCQRKVVDLPPRQGIDMPLLPLHGQVVVVTGASEGIGEAIARILAINGGANVVLAARQEEKLKILAEKIAMEVEDQDRSPFVIACDISQHDQVSSLVSGTIGKFGKVDVLVNCAGCMYYCLAEKGFTEEWKRQIDVNVLGTTLVTGAILPHMVQQHHGHIVNITSDAGKRGFPGLSVYSGTKFYLEGFMQALRQEVVEHSIRITNIQPGDVDTHLAGRSTDLQAKTRYDQSMAGHKILTVEDLARSVLFVLSQPAHVAVNEMLIEPQAAPI